MTVAAAFCDQYPPEHASCHVHVIPLATIASLLTVHQVWKQSTVSRDDVSYGQLRQNRKTFHVVVNWSWCVVTGCLCVLYRHSYSVTYGMLLAWYPASLWTVCSNDDTGEHDGDTSSSDCSSQMERMLLGKPGVGTRCMDASVHTIKYAAPLPVSLILSYCFHTVVCYCWLLSMTKIVYWLL